MSDGRGMRKRMRNKKNDNKTFLENGALLIEAAVEYGNTTRSKISKATGLKLHEINKVFESNRELWAFYTVRRRSILDIATDNIQDIVEDKSHPQNYQASLHIIKTYKSDLDNGVLEKQDDGKIDVDIKGSGKSKAPKVSIKFSK